MEEEMLPVGSVVKLMVVSSPRSVVNSPIFIVVGSGLLDAEVVVEGVVMIPDAVVISKEPAVVPGSSVSGTSVTVCVVAVADAPVVVIIFFKVVSVAASVVVEVGGARAVVTGTVVSSWSRVAIVVVPSVSMPVRALPVVVVGWLVVKT